MNMAKTTYRELADAVFNKIKDVDFASIDEEIAYQIVISYMRPAIVAFQSAKQNLSDRDDELEQFNFTLSDDTFIILVNYMVIEWLNANFILTSSALKSRISTADFHSLQLSNMLSKAMELRTLLKSENDQLAINKSYRDSKLFDLVTNRKKV